MRNYGQVMDYPIVQSFCYENGLYLFDYGGNFKEFGISQEGIIRDFGRIMGHIECAVFSKIWVDYDKIDLFEEFQGRGEEGYENLKYSEDEVSHDDNGDSEIEVEETETEDDSDLTDDVGLNTEESEDELVDKGSAGKEKDIEQEELVCVKRTHKRS